MNISFWLLSLLILIVSSHSLAHKPSDSYLKININNKTAKIQWDIALRDLDHYLQLDKNGDRLITWGEIKEKHASIEQLARTNLAINEISSVSCQYGQVTHKVDKHSDGYYAVLFFDAQCTNTIQELTIQYHLFFEFDNQHRGLISISSQNNQHTDILSPDKTEIKINTQKTISPYSSMMHFITQGIIHIAEGVDHILFIISLLISIIYTTRKETTKKSSQLINTSKEVLKMVTVFTIAHSITLVLTTLGFIQIPSRLVESVIAFSILIVAINNLYPKFIGHHLLLVFGFGLIHGMGFASVLDGLLLNNTHQLLALLGFNIGVEVGQIAIVLLTLILLYPLYRQAHIRIATNYTSSAIIAVISAIWLIERSLDTTLTTLV